MPDHCTIEIDRRLVPGESPDEAQRHVIDFIAEETGRDPAIEHDRPFLLGHGLSDKENGPLAARMVAAARAAGIASEATGVPYGTDAAAIAAAGVPSIVFGPGSIDQAHTADEWVELDQVAQASEALYRFGCGGLRPVRPLRPDPPGKLLSSGYARLRPMAGSLSPTACFRTDPE